ncbi:hypothetical protein QF035_009078 [Streptomyces umbrinus]|uniref:Transcriptional regulator n=1 Tax=Streptomyces umbrinus TaxID=67370 RepID=A0ABU0T973_9ACTN|nr:hypothetical protein [Streptomyces umbrinus]MDQ1031496.1 hypothetical protein [Streptomyces umbrinus]
MPTDPVRPTEFRKRVIENNWTMVEKFNMVLQNVGKELADQTADQQRASKLRTIFVPKRRFDRWMRGDVEMPQRDIRFVLQHMFNMTAEELFRTIPASEPTATAPANDSLRGVVKPSEPPTYPEYVTPATQAAQEYVGSAPGPFTSNVARTIALLGFDDPVAVAAQTRALTTSNAEPADLAMIGRGLQDIVDVYEDIGPVRLAGRVRGWRDKLRGLALGGQQPPRARTETFRLIAQASGLMAYMAVNAGAPVAVADAYCTEAEDLAREAGDTSLEMWIAGTRSLGLYYAGKYKESDAAAAAGIELAPHSDQAIRLLVNGRARSLARCGDRTGSERVMGQALALSDRHSGLPEGLSSCISFGPYSMARTLANAVTARLHLGDTGRVLRLVDEIDGLISHSTSQWSRALVGLDVATALLQQDGADVEQAMTLGHRALRAGTTAPIHSVWKRANELYDHAGRWHDLPDVRDYAEDLREWRSRPQAELIVAGSSAGSAL